MISSIPALCGCHQIVPDQSMNTKAKIAASQTRVIFKLMSLGIPGRNIAHHAHDSQEQSKGCKTPRNNVHIAAFCLNLLHIPCAVHA